MADLYQNKQPKWNDQIGAFVLNFNKRVSTASVKNFQLVSQNDPDVVARSCCLPRCFLTNVVFRQFLCKDINGSGKKPHRVGHPVASRRRNTSIDAVVGGIESLQVGIEGSL